MRFEREPLDVHKMARCDVFGNNRAAPCAGSERHRRVESVRVADCAERGLRVHENAHRRFFKRELHDDVRVFRVNHHRVSDAAELEQLDAAMTRVAPAVVRVERKHGRKFFARHRMLAPNARDFCNQHARVRGYADARLLRNPHRRFPDAVRIDCALVAEHQTRKPIFLFACDEIRAALFAFFNDRVLDRRIAHERRLG